MFVRSTMLAALFALMPAGFIPVAAEAQIPDVQPGFPNAHSCTPGQLLFRQIGLGRIANIAYHNGVLYSNNVGGGSRREIRFSDPSDPASLAIVREGDLPLFNDQGTHSHTKVGEWLFSAWGGGLKRESDGVNIEESHPESSLWQQQDGPDGGGLHRIYWPWAVPFNWIQYGSNPGRARLWRHDQLLAEWEALALDAIAGNGILLGDVLFMVSDASMLGVVAYDIAPTFNDPPEPPRVLDKLTGSFGAYIGAVWENYLVLAGGEPRDLLYVVDISDPTDLRLVTTMDLSGTPELNAGTNVPYVQTQDQFVFTRRHKIDMERLEPVLELDEVGEARPAGSVSGALDVSQYTLPLGNLLISGSYSAGGRDGLGVWCHAAGPDRRAPYVGYHVPQDGRTGYPTGAPISLVIAETLESWTIVNGESIVLRPVGGEPVDAWTSFAHDGVLTLTPKLPLLSDTTYELVVPPGGIQDAAGNGIEGLSFTFSTGSSVDGGNRAPEILAFDVSPSPAAPAETVSISAQAADPENDGIEYRVGFGDGTPMSDWSSGNNWQHAFSEPGHYSIKVQVRDLKPDGTRSVTTQTRTVSIAPLPTSPLPAASSTITVDEVRRVVWVVNPDHGSVARLDADSGARLSETGLGPDSRPVSIAVDDQGRAWVALAGDDRITLLDIDGSEMAAIETGYGSAPAAVAIAGGRVFATLKAGGSTDARNGQLLRIDPVSATVTGQVELGADAGALAVTGDGARAFVARFISAKDFGEIWDVDTDAMTVNRTLEIWRDRGGRGLDSGGSDGPGVPNYIASLVLDPHQNWLWYTGIKADTNRGEFFDQGHGTNLPLTHDSTVRAVLGRFDLQHESGAPREPGRDTAGAGRGRVDIDNSDSPSALLFSPRGDYAFATLQGNDALAVFDALEIENGGGRTSIWRTATGAAPRGLAWDDATEAVWVQDFMDRTATRVDLSEFLALGVPDLPSASFPTSGTEPLADDVLAGKRLFFLAGSDPFGFNEMSFEGYISCASCHIDGGHDGRTWDFTQRGEGLRNTTDLRGRGGMLHGNVHWSGNFDEIQDFVLDIVNEFGGIGFLPAGESPHPSLGTANAGRSVELDQLAAYVESLDRSKLPKSPYRQPDGRMSDAALRGRDHFIALDCATCHVPLADYTDSIDGPALHDVGTLRTSSGRRLNGPLDGIDTPTLLGIWDAPAYFHDGSAETLEDVFSVAGGTMYEAEDAVLILADVPDFATINQDSSFHGEMVQFNVIAGSVTWSSVDGGGGGSGAVELRYSAGDDDTFGLYVNGEQVATQSVIEERTRLEWRRLRFENVPLRAGQTNIVSVVLESGGYPNPSLDHITVSTADDLLLAAPHRDALALDATERAELEAYVLELDGRDAEGAPEPRDLIFRDDFDSR